ncbi:MAG: hypothetical protein ABTA16_00710 [Niallia sp.]
MIKPTPDNPYPQYDIPPYTTKNNLLGNESWVKLFELDFKNDSATNWRNLQRVIFSAYVYDMSNDEQRQKFGVFTLMFRAKANDTHQCNIAYTGFIDTELSKYQEYFRAYVYHIGVGEWKVSVYGKVLGYYGKLRLEPFKFDSINFAQDTRVLPYVNGNLNSYRRVDSFLKDMENNDFISSSQLPTDANYVYSDLEDKKVTKLVQSISDTRTTLNADTINEFSLVQPSATLITSINGGYTGQIIYLQAFNDLTSIQHNSQIVLNKQTNLNIKNGGVLGLRYNAGKWYEIFKSFIDPVEIEQLEVTDNRTSLAVSNKKNINLAQTAATTITSITGGVSGQIIYIQSFSGFSTIQNNSGIVLRGNTNINIPNSGVLTLRFNAGKWYDINHSWE